jgi:hypothetical protein
VVIRAIDQDDFRGRLLESLGSGQSAKATADDNNSWMSHCSPQFPSVFFPNTGARTMPPVGPHLPRRTIDVRLSSCAIYIPGHTFGIATRTSG